MRFAVLCRAAAVTGDCRCPGPGPIGEGVKLLSRVAFSFALLW